MSGSEEGRRTWVMSSTTLNENAGELWRRSRNCPWIHTRDASVQASKSNETKYAHLFTTTNLDPQNERVSASTQLE